MQATTSMPLSMKIFVALSTFAQVSYVASQGQATTNATCTTAQWTNNEHGQSPCLVAAGLRQSCTSGNFNLGSLKAGNEYVGPMAGQSTSCFCSSVTYSMVSACAICQAGTYLPWDLWITNCTADNINLQKTPVAIPGGVSVPAWAYLDVNATGTFDSAHASAIAVSSATPDVTGTDVPAFVKSIGSSSSGGSHTGAIAGGVVGGIVALLLIALGAFICVKKRRNQGPRRHIGHSSAVIQGLEDQASLAPPPSMTYIKTAPMRLYDPSDPSTFPPSPGPSVPGSQSLIISPTSATHPPTSYDHSTHNRNRSGSSTTSLPNSQSNISAVIPPIPGPPLSGGAVPPPQSGSPNHQGHGRNVSAETGYTHTQSQSHGRNISGGAPGYTGIAEV